MDLVFYHRILKCHVLFELKVGSFTHEHIGQLNTYVSWHADNEKTEDDNPPVGILLCTEKDNTVVKYALAGMSNQLFVTKYQVALPSEAEIRRDTGPAGGGDGMMSKFLDERPIQAMPHNWHNCKVKHVVRILRGKFTSG